VTGTLYLIPTALGDTPWSSYLAPLSRDVACSLKHFIVENAKTARAELKRIGHPLPLRDLSMEQLPDSPNDATIETLLQPLDLGLDIGLMSEAGCPAIADPGAALVRRAHAKRMLVRPLVGASSLLLALMASGLDGQRFAFHGYLPQRDPERCRKISELEVESRHRQQTQLFIETPYRNRSLFDALLLACQAATLLCVAIDLTQAGESVVTRSIAEWRRLPAPDLDRHPTVFLLLSAR
jgi:16S rRNA (cytidine1402-2'-O)-methyltransferase